MGDLCLDKVTTYNRLDEAIVRIIHGKWVAVHSLPSITIKPLNIPTLIKLTTYRTDPDPNR